MKVGNDHPLAWLIDTNIGFEMMRPRPERRVAAFLDSIADEGLGLASITISEVFDGIGRLPRGGHRTHLATRFSRQRPPPAALQSLGGMGQSSAIPASRS